MHTIQRVHPSEASAITFLDHLQGKHAYALGFLPFQALAEAIARGNVLRAYENGSPCGYMIHGKIGETTRILQTVVAADARRIEHATALVDGVTMLANDIGGYFLKCHCAEDLEANQFWRALGFEAVGRRLKNRNGTRWQIAYQKELPGKKLAAIIENKRLEQAGVTSLRRLLLKGDARIGGVDIAKFRSSHHHFELG